MKLIGLILIIISQNSATLVKLTLGICNKSSRQFKDESTLEVYINSNYSDYLYIPQSFERISSKMNIALLHKNCNQLYFPRLKDFKQGKSNCTFCTKSNIYNPHKYSSILAKAILDDKYILKTPSYTFNKRIELECKVCGYCWSPNISDYMQSKSNCNYCSRTNHLGVFNPKVVERNKDYKIYLYEFVIHDDKDTYYKYGLSINPRSRRLKLQNDMRNLISKDIKVEMTDSIFTTLDIAFNIEQYIKKESQQIIFDCKFGGYTEIYNEQFNIHQALAKLTN